MGAKKAMPTVRYNVQLPAIKAYACGVVTLRGVPSVHIRLGEVTHVVYADSAIALAEAIVEQARFAQKMAEVWAKAWANRKTEDARQTEIGTTPVTT